MRLTALVLAAIVPLAFPHSVHAQGRWIFYAFNGLPGMLSYGRLDPIISPGAVSSHVHQIQGGNAFGANYDYNTLRSQSTCSTIEVQDDLSNYWAPALYSYDVTNYNLMLASFHTYYQYYTNSWDPNNSSGSPQRYPFPPGMKFLGGDMYQRSINTLDPRSMASIFQCQRANGSSPYSHDIRDFQRSGLNCDNSLRATTRMPSCWDGVADNSDLTHVTYPGFNNVCPSSHPYAFMQITLEWYWPVQKFPFDPTRVDNWVFSYGDTSGFGFHGDFANGWNATVLQQAINSCNGSATASGINECPPFSKWVNTRVPPCMPSGLYPDENVGLNGQTLTALPGCNPLWTDNSTKPTCNNVPATPTIDLQLGPNLTSWNYLSCPFAYNAEGWILTAHSHTHWGNMTVDSCLAECQSYNYSYALVEWGANCYCDNQIKNDVPTTSDPNYACLVRCPNDYTQFCGGYGSGALFQACTGSACHSYNGTLPAPANTTTLVSSTTPVSLSTPVSPSTISQAPSTGSTTKTKKKKKSKTANGGINLSITTKWRTQVITSVVTVSNAVTVTVPNSGCSMR